MVHPQEPFDSLRRGKYVTESITPQLVCEGLYLRRTICKKDTKYKDYILFEILTSLVAWTSIYLDDSFHWSYPYLAPDLIRLLSAKSETI